MRISIWMQEMIEGFVTTDRRTGQADAATWRTQKKTVEMA